MGRHLAFVVALAAAAGCSSDGSITGPGDGTGPGGRQVRDTCDPDAPPPAETPLRRLTRVQMIHTIDHLVDTFAPDAASSIKDTLAESYDRLPADVLTGTRHGGLARLDQALQQQLSDAVYQLSLDVARELTASSARITQVVGACATDGTSGNDDDCLADFVRTFAARAFRQPLTADEVAFYTAAPEEGPVTPASLARVIGLVLASPQFFYHMEHGLPDADGDGPVPLSAHEQAARLSYHLWDAPPDDELWQLADSGDLLDDDVYAAQVERMLTDPRAAAALGQFFTEWLELDLVPRLDGRVGEALFDAFAGDDVPDPALRDAVIADVVAAAQYEMKNGGSFSSFLRNTHSFAQHDGLAAIYDAPTWDGSTEPPALDGRAGLLTRAAFLVTGSPSTRPVRKGIFIRAALLCDEVPPPPADADLTPPVPTEELTTRESLELRTETEGTICAGCHTPYINHLGYATEGFDALGRARTAETLHDADGEPLRDKPVDTVSIPQVIAGDMTESTGPEDLTDLIDASGKAHSCLARDYFRFTFERLEDELRDGCLLAGLEEQAQLDRPLVEVFAHALLDPNFRTKRFDDE